MLSFLKIFRPLFKAVPINADYYNMESSKKRPDISMQVLNTRYLLDVIYIGNNTQLNVNYEIKKQKYKSEYDDIKSTD